MKLFVFALLMGPAMAMAQALPATGSANTQQTTSPVISQPATPVAPAAPAQIFRPQNQTQPSMMGTPAQTTPAAPRYQTRSSRQGQTTSSLGDLVYFPRQGQVYMVTHGVGMFRSTKDVSGAGGGKLNHNMFMFGGKALFALSDYIALGAGLSFAYSKLEMAQLTLPGAADDLTGNEDQDNQEGERNQNSLTNISFNTTQKQLSPALLLSFNPLGQGSMLPASMRIDLSFAPEWLQYMPEPGVSAQMGEQVLPMPRTAPTPAPDKTSDLGIKMQVAFKAHPAVQLGLGAAYSKGFNFSKSSNTPSRPTTDDEETEAPDKWTIISRMMQGRSEGDSSLKAGLAAQFSIQNRAFIHTGLAYNMQLGDNKDTEGAAQNEDGDNHNRKDLTARLGVRALVSSQMAVHVGGGYQLWNSKPANDPSKWTAWAIAAGLQAVF